MGQVTADEAEKRPGNAPSAAAGSPSPMLILPKAGRLAVGPPGCSAGEQPIPSALFCVRSTFPVPIAFNSEHSAPCWTPAPMGSWQIDAIRNPTLHVKMGKDHFQKPERFHDSAAFFILPVLVSMDFENLAQISNFAFEGQDYVA
jgi:hypothetical protein